MPRKLRIQYPGAMYHVMNRGDQREAHPEIAERLQMGTWTYVSNLLIERAEVSTAQELLPLCQ